MRYRQGYPRMQRNVFFQVLNNNQLMRPCLDRNLTIQFEVGVWCKIDGLDKIIIMLDLIEMIIGKEWKGLD